MKNKKSGFKCFKMVQIIIIFQLLISGSVRSQSNINISNSPFTPSVFEKGLISTGLSERDFTISPSGDEIFFTIQSSRFIKSIIIQIRKINNSWQQPVIASFSGKFKDLEASFSPDGKTVYFSSDRPVNNKDTTADFDIWKIVKEPESGNWSDPINLGNTVNSEKDEFYPSVTKSGNIYFTVVPDDGYGQEDIVMCSFVNEAYQSRKILDSTINTKGYEFNAFVDPDEKFIIFTSLQGRSDEIGGGDLYISKKNADGSWGMAYNLGTRINSSGIDYCPFVSWDKRTLFFTSNRNSFGSKQIRVITEFKELLTSPGNGADDIYWVNINEILQH